MSELLKMFTFPLGILNEIFNERKFSGKDNNIIIEQFNYIEAEQKTTHQSSWFCNCFIEVDNRCQLMSF